MAPRPQQAPPRGGAAPPRSRRPSRRRQSSESEVGCCMKYSMFGFNVIFWLIGGLILFVGCYAFIEKGLIHDIETVSHVPVDPALSLMIMGSIVFVVAFSGCIGSLRENICFLKFFALVLTVLFFAEVLAGVLAYIYRDDVVEKTNSFIIQNIKAYRDDPDLQDIIDAIQMELECCGGKDPDDWDNNMYFNCTGTERDNLIPEACGVPFSCCKRDEDATDVINTQCGFNTRGGSIDFDIYQEGCIAKMENLIKENLISIAVVALFVLVLQVMAISFGMSLVSDINRQRSKWRLNERLAAIAGHSYT